MRSRGESGVSVDREGSEVLGAGICVPANVSLGVSAPWPVPVAKKENDPPRASPPRPHDSSRRNHAGHKPGGRAPRPPCPALPQPDAGVCSALSTRPLHGAETPPGRRPRGCRHHPRWLAGTWPGEVAPRDRARGQDVHPGLCCPLCPVPAAVVAVRPVEGVPLLGLCAMGVSARE